MENRNCPQCGAPMESNAESCKFCGGANNAGHNKEAVFQEQCEGPRITLDPGINPNWPVKNKIVAGILGILLGGLGVHKFYLGRIGWGVLYVLFCWTYIPSLVGLIEGIIYLTSSDYNFQIKNKVIVL